MKFNRISWPTWNQGETIATFGEARLVKNPDGKVELIGGTPENRTAAREWISLFLHEVVIAR